MPFGVKTILLHSFLTLGSGTLAANTRESAEGADSLSFAATADPQFNKNTHHARVGFQNDIDRYLLAKLYNDKKHKGLIIAGGLTKHTYKWETPEFYNSLLANEETEISTILERSKE